jgi:hypothetical protein
MGNKSFARNQSFSSEFSVLRCEVHPHGESWFGEIRYQIVLFGSKIKTASSSLVHSMVKSRPSAVLALPHGVTTVDSSQCQTAMELEISPKLPVKANSELARGSSAGSM